MHIFVNFMRMIRECLYARMRITYIENICVLAFNCAWFSRELASFFKDVLYMYELGLSDLLIITIFIGNRDNDYKVSR